MITDFLIEWFVTIVGAVIETFPESSIDLAAVASAWSQLGALNYFLPIQEVTMAVGAVIALGPAFLVVTIAQWLLVGILRGGESRA